MSDPNSRQVGGDHYDVGGALQHWDLVEDYGLGYLEGCATKYISRHRRKNGVEDLRKADHYVEKMISMGLRARGFVPAEPLSKFCSSHGLSINEIFCMSILTGHWELRHLGEVRIRIQDMIRDYKRGIQDGRPEESELATINAIRSGERLEGSEPR